MGVLLVSLTGTAPHLLHEHSLSCAEIMSLKVDVLCDAGPRGNLSEPQFPPVCGRGSLGHKEVGCSGVWNRAWHEDESQSRVPGFPRTSSGSSVAEEPRGPGGLLSTLVAAAPCSAALAHRWASLGLSFLLVE